MSSSQENHIIKDSQIIKLIMNDLGIREYDHQVVNQLLEFNYSTYLQWKKKVLVCFTTIYDLLFCLLGYTAFVLEEAKAYSTFANKDEVDVDDVKLAIDLSRDNVFFKSPPRHVILYYF